MAIIICIGSVAVATAGAGVGAGVKVGAIVFKAVLFLSAGPVTCALMVKCSTLMRSIPSLFTSKSSILMSSLLFRAVSSPSCSLSDADLLPDGVLKLKLTSESASLASAPVPWLLSLLSVLLGTVDMLKVLKPVLLLLYGIDLDAVSCWTNLF